MTPEPGPSATGSGSDAGSDSPSQPGRARGLLGATLVYLALAFFLTSSTWRDPTNRWIGGCCDQEQAMWFLAWTPAAIGRGQDPLLTDRLNAPAGANLMWNASEPLVGLLVAPITATAGPILAYNVAVVIAIVLSGLAAFFALRRHAAGSLGPLVGGGLYAISPYVASHTALHLNLVSAWAPPLFLILFDELAVRRRRRPEVLGVLVGLVAVVQLLTSEEILATSAVAAGVLAVVLAGIVRKRTAIEGAARRIARAAIPAFATFLVLGGLPLAVQFLGPQQIHGSVTDSARYSTDLLNLVLPTPYQLIAPAGVTTLSSQFSGLYHEATAYVGVPLLLLLAWVVARRRRDRLVTVAAILAVVMFVLSLGPQLTVAAVPTGLPMPWAPLGALPILEHVVPGRLTLFMWLAIAVLVSTALDRGAASSGESIASATAGVPRRRIAATGLALMFVLPSAAASSTVAVPAFFRSWGTQAIADDQVVLFAPWFADGAGADPMLWAAIAGTRPRTFEGYVYVPGRDGRPQYGPSGGQIGDLMTSIQDEGIAVVARGSVRDAALRQLDHVGVAVVIVGPMAHLQQMVQFFTDLLGAQPDAVDGVLIWRDVPTLVRGQLGGGA